MADPVEAAGLVPSTLKATKEVVTLPTKNPVNKVAVDAKFKRAPRSSIALSSSHSPDKKSSDMVVDNVHKVVVLALFQVGIMIAYVADAKDDSRPAFMGFFTADLLANFNDYATKLKIHAVKQRRSKTSLTEYREVVVPRNSGTITVQDSLMIHVAESPESLRSEKARKGFGKNIATILNLYARLKFRWPQKYAFTKDMTMLAAANNHVLGDYLTLQDTMDIVTENIYQGHTSESAARDDEILASFFGSNRNAARRYFVQGITENSDETLEEW